MTAVPIICSAYQLDNALMYMDLTMHARVMHCVYVLGTTSAGVLQTDRSMQARTRRILMSSLRAFTVSIALASENTVAGASCPRGFGALNVDIAIPHPCMIV